MHIYPQLLSSHSQHHISPRSSPLTFHALTTNPSFSSIQFLLQRRQSTLALVRQSIVEVLYLCARLEMGWNGGMEHGTEYGMEYGME